MKFIKSILLVVTLSIFLCSCQNQTKNSINKTIVENSYDDIEAAIARYKKLKNEDFEAYNFNDENELNNLGYQLLNDNRIDDAIKIFRLLVSEFPNSANAYDSLGEAYLANKNTDLALKNGESLEVKSRIRYRQKLEKATLHKVENGIYVEFKNAQSAITEGQFVAWYINDELLGSGVIA